jgi:ferritin-like protein
MQYICDRARHLVCVPYSIANLHKMAEDLGIKRAWFHKDHYDIPKRRIAEITAKCTVVSSKEIVQITGGRKSKKKKKDVAPS